jgi:osmoprotectant transport system substrate-binding protein
MKKFLIVIMMFCLVAGFAVANGKQEKKSLTVGAKNYTEQYVSGNLIALLLEDNGFEIKKQFGTGSAITRDGLMTGQTDLYAEYTGTAWQVYLKHEDMVNDPVDLYNKVKAEDAENGIVWLDRWPLNDTYALAIKKDSVSKFGKSISTLGEYITANPDDILVGLDSEFYERPDGFFGMSKVYGFELEKKYVKTMDLGLGYEALNRDQVNVAMVFSTDGLLKKYDLQVLEDDKQFFPVYNISVSVREEILTMYPEIEEILRPLAVMDDVTMQNLNYQVDAEGLPAEVVAKKYLQEKGLLK